MSLGNIQPFPGRTSVRNPEAVEGKTPHEPQEPLLVFGPVVRPRAEARTDFNPLMERALRAHQMAEGRRHCAPQGDTLS